MTAGSWDITIEQGADFQLPLTYSDSTGKAIDITGWSAQMMIRQSYFDSIPLISLASPSNGITLGGTAGTISIDIPGVTTSTLPPGISCYDIKMLDSLGIPQRLIEGTVTIKTAVTR